MLRFRARTVPELLDASFQVMRATFWELCLVTLVITWPAMVLQLLLPEAWIPFAEGLDMVLGSYSTAATVLIVSDVYLGRGVDITAAMRRTLARFGAILGAALVRFLLVGLGLLACVVPGIIAMVVTFAMPIVVVLERCTAMEAFARSRALARDQWGRIVGAYVLTYVLALLMSLGAAAVLTLLGGGTYARLVKILIGVIFHPFVAVVGTLLYYDLRIRKEGFDIEMLVTAVGALGDQPPAAGAHPAT